MASFRADSALSEGLISTQIAARHDELVHASMSCEELTHLRYEFGVAIKMKGIEWRDM
jgi:hypothetical protein